MKEIDPKPVLEKFKESDSRFITLDIMNRELGVSITNITRILSAILPG
jgi:hypothetical protein